MAKIWDIQLLPPQMRGSIVIDDSESQLSPLSSDVNRASMLKAPSNINSVAHESIVAKEMEEHAAFDVEATRTSKKMIGNTTQEDDMDTSNDLVQNSDHPTEPMVSYSFDEGSRFLILMG